MKKNLVPFVVLLVAVSFLMAACGGSETEQSSPSSSGNPAMVDGVVVETINEHQYAVVNGFYPDPCTRISDITQDVEGSRFVISLATDSPDDMVCAQMLAEYEISLLLETGGLLPGGYSVDVNGVTTSFSIGE